MGAIIINSKERSKQVDLKHVIVEEKNYLEYIEEHVSNVSLAFRKLFLDKEFEFPLEREIQNKKKYTVAESKRLLQEVQEEIKTHDNSKYYDEEFYAYRRKFNPTKLEKEEQDKEIIDQVEKEYEDAWYHHFTHNPHHPKFWKYCKVIKRDGLGEPLEIEPKKEPLEIAEIMSMVSILHMICDWEAMSIKFGGSTIDWYINKAKDERSYMHPYTRKIVEQVLEIVYNITLPSKEEIDAKDKESDIHENK